MLDIATDVIPLTAYCEEKECLNDAFYTYRYYSVNGRECPALYFDPLIIVGGSRLRSSIRRIKRDIKEDKSLVDAIFREIRRYNSYVKELDDSKDNYKNKIKEIIKECIEELEISF